MTMTMTNQNQNRINYLQKSKGIAGILALIIGVVSFGINYYVALKTYPNTPIWVTRILYYGCFIALSLAFFGLTVGSKNRIKQLIYYAGCNFYLFLCISYLLNQFLDILVRQNKIIFTLLLTITSCIIYYLITARHS